MTPQQILSAKTLAQLDMRYEASKAKVFPKLSRLSGRRIAYRLSMN